VCSMCRIISYLYIYYIFTMELLPISSVLRRFFYHLIQSTTAACIQISLYVAHNIYIYRIKFDTAAFILLP
jgi:hypothetical protein